jgi:hypothetical protein
MRTRSGKWLLLSLSLLLGGCGYESYPAGLPTAPAAPTSPVPAIYTLSGVVLEPTGDPVVGAHVGLPGKTAITDEAGRYTIGEMSGLITLEVSKEGYEATVAGLQVSSDQVLNLVLIPMIRIVAGESRTVTLFDADRGYQFPYSYSDCASPCKLIRVTAPAVGSVTIKLTAGDLAGKLSVFIDDASVEYCCAAQLTIPFPFLNAGEQIFYVRFADPGPSGTDRRIDIATSFQPR